jgi:L-malate glycosyltransferase
MVKGRNVIICIPVLLSGGGTEVQVLGLIRALLNGGYEVAVCCYYEHDEAMVERYQETGIRVILMDLRREAGLVALLKALRSLLVRERPDIVHVQYLAPGLIPIMAARLAGIRTVFSTVHVAGRAAYGWKHKALLRFAARLCTTFFCVSRSAEQFWFGDSEVFEPSTATSGRRHFTIYNGVDVDAIRSIVLSSFGPPKLRSSEAPTLRRSSVPPSLPTCPGRAGPSNPPTLRCSDARKTVGIVGRLSPQKGHSVLLEAMATVAAEVPDVLVLVIGDGPDRAVLEQQVTSHRLRDHVAFTGVLPQDEVFRLYGTMDVLAMPSLFEGFGLTAAEAMAAGLPVVGTRIEGLSEVIDDGVTGYLVPPGDSGALAGRLVELLNDPGKRRRMGQAGHARVKAHFSMERYCGSILGAYRYFSAERENK